MMPFFGIVWMTSWVSCFLASSQALLKVPDYLSGAFPASVLSVVSSPIEIPTSPLYSEAFSHSSSVSTMSKPGLVGVGTGVSPLPTLLAQSGVSSSFRLNGVENLFCRPESGQKKEYKPAVGKPSSLSALRKEKSIDEAPEKSKSRSNSSEKTISQQILQAIKIFLPKGEQVEPIKKVPPDSVLVISTQSGKPLEENYSSTGGAVQRGLRRYSQLLTARAFAATTPKGKEQFQVWLKGRLIAQLPSQPQAVLMAKKLKKFIFNLSEQELNTSSIEPILIDELPAVKFGERLVFKIDDVLAEGINRNRKLLTVEWANNIRKALGQAPLKLAKAQKQMYNLVETGNTLGGVASWYGDYFHGRLTANGEKYDQYEFTAAHRTLPFDTYLKVRNLKNDDTVIVRINDRGPFIDGRNLDLSRQAARCLNSENVGIVPYEAVIMKTPSTQSGRYVVSN
ncbi:MAG: septal ring lytic transglycosylase RlpA family protein [Coleofasciculaceae cyanobacterium]